MSELQNIKIELIRANTVALRPVDKESEKFKELVADIGQKGILNAISVRQKEDPETKETYYELVDGLQRYSAACEAALATVPAQILDLDDLGVLEAQLSANVHKIETKPVEYSKQILRIFAANPTLTMAELGKRLNKSPGWIKERLNLLKLSEGVAKLVDTDKIVLSNAYALAKLPMEEQANFADRAQTMSPAEFVPIANKRVKELRDAAREGRKAGAAEFVATPYLQKLAILKAEREKPTITPQLIKKAGITDPFKAAVLVLDWVLHMDEDSVVQAKAKDEERKKLQAETRKKRALEREEQKAKKAQENVAKLREEASTAAVGAGAK